MLSRILEKLGYVKKPYLQGAAISTHAQHDLDYVFEKTGLRSHKVGEEQRFNAALRTKDDPEADKVEALLWKYARRGYVFTDDSGLLVGNVCSVATKEDRIALKRSNIRLVSLDAAAGDPLASARSVDDNQQD